MEGNSMQFFNEKHKCEICNIQQFSVRIHDVNKSSLVVLPKKLKLRPAQPLVPLNTAVLFRAKGVHST